MSSNCQVVDFNGQDGYELYTPGSYRGDWAPGYNKGNCGANHYIKGFSVARNAIYTE